MRAFLPAAAFAASVAAVAVAACGLFSGDNSSTPSDGGDEGNGGFGATGDGSTTQGLSAKKVSCNGGPKTTITGRVMDPAGKNPLYNVIVYIPNDPSGALPKLTSGVSCDTCGTQNLNPASSTLTDENGNFTLDDVPVATGIPIVVQIGKWRKKISFDVTKQCAENKLTAPISLPAKATDGDMPQIAVTTGGADSLECLLLGMGIDQSEFVYGNGGSGHVHMFAGADGYNANNQIPKAQDALWTNAQSLAPYDILALSCEDGEHVETKDKNNIQGMYDYIQSGGRVLASHYHYVWFKDSPQYDFAHIAAWEDAGVGYEPTGVNPYNVVTTFPKGQAFSKWLVNVGASTMPGVVPLDNVTASIAEVKPGAQSWIQHDDVNVKYLSFNAPLSATADKQCGRVVLGDLHVSGTSEASFPDKCTPAPGSDLTPQQKALEFLFFDLSSCVLADTALPQPPK
jgi:hypothetical protein